MIINMEENFKYYPCPRCLGTGKQKEFIMSNKIKDNEVVIKTKKNNCNLCKGIGLLKIEG